MHDSEAHLCASHGCVHVVQYSDERHCYYHTAPVMVFHSCIVEGCPKSEQFMALTSSQGVGA